MVPRPIADATISDTEARSSRPDKQVKRILAVDGGGVRGIIAIEVLLRLEDGLAKASEQPSTRLADHFHLVAGTSAGAIIASSVALRIPMREIRDFVLANTKSMFLPASLTRRIRHRYDKRQLEQNLKNWFGDETTLGSERLRTLLLLIMRNASTDAPWLVSNNPYAPFNRRDLDDCNLNLKLWQLARASAAAPSYFEPELVTLGSQRPYSFVYVDGGLTGFNNPAFKAFLYATTESYGVNWAPGEDRLLVLSLGTGAARQWQPLIKTMRMQLWDLAPEVARALIFASEREQDLLCRTFGRCRMGEPIDLEVGDLRHVRTAVEPKLFTYFRVNAMLTRQGLADLGCGHIDPEHVHRLDSIRYVDELRQIGNALADRAVTANLIEQLF
jgi:hypothetical protein